MSPPSSDKGTAGFALLVVLSFLLLAAAISTPFFSIARDYALISRNFAQASRDEAVAEGVLTLAAQRYLEWASGRYEAPDTVSCGSDGRYSAVEVSFRNHAGLIDVNTASSELLQLGFIAVSASATDAAQLAAAVEAYRAVNLTGVPDDDAPAVVGGLKHSLFESVTELLDFRLPNGVTAVQLGNIFTVHSRSGTVDERYASVQLQLAFGAMAQEALPFVISGSRRLPAFTVSAILRYRGDVGVHASAIYLPAGEQGIARRSGPVVIRRAALEPGAPDLLADGCERFFDQGSLSLLAELVK